MKEFTPDKYLGHKIKPHQSRSIDRYFDRKRCSKQNVHHEVGWYDD